MSLQMNGAPRYAASRTSGKTGAAEKLEQRLGASVLADPQQTLPRRVDLVHEREEVRTVLPMDFIDADRSYSREIHVGAAPRHGHRHRAEHLIPTGAEDARGLLPTEAFGPAGEKPHVGRGQLMLAVGPGHLFDRDATARALDAPHHVQEEDAQAPERHELEPAR